MKSDTALLPFAINGMGDHVEDVATLYADMFHALGDALFLAAESEEADARTACLLGWIIRGHAAELRQFLTLKSVAEQSTKGAAA